MLSDRRKNLPTTANSSSLLLCVFLSTIGLRPWLGNTGWFILALMFSDFGWLGGNSTPGVIPKVVSMVEVETLFRRSPVHVGGSDVDSLWLIPVPVLLRMSFMMRADVLPSETTFGTVESELELRPPHWVCPLPW